MPFAALTCPQCSAPLPRQAYWRRVACSYCGVMVSRSAQAVQASEFHEAHKRVQGGLAVPAREIRCIGKRYRVMARIGHGESCDVFLAETVSPLRERVVLKMARKPGASAALLREAEVLRELQALKAPGAPYYTQRLPQPAGVGLTPAEAGEQKQVLVLRHAPGYWGSCADVLANHPGGVDARHAVWMWRRVLEVAGFLHGAGWTHGDLIPAHLLVHPWDHGILLIGWSRAARGGNVARDLMQSAWCMRTMLSGDADGAILPGTPAPLATLLRKASEDEAWSRLMGAQGLDDALRLAAAEAFGPPKFLHFNPLAGAAANHKEG